jgi:hypothetical protein
MLPTIAVHTRLIHVVPLLLAAALIASLLLSPAHRGVAVAVAAIQATKTDALLTDADNDGTTPPSSPARSRPRRWPATIAIARSAMSI